jgi:DNA polymerase V
MLLYNTVYMNSIKQISRPIPIENTSMILPAYDCAISAGFPSPAADHAQKPIDLNEHLIRNKAATFLFRVQGDSMTGIGIYGGDTLLVDRSIEPRHNSVVLAVVNNDFTVKRLYRRGGVIRLMAENSLYPPIIFKEAEELEIWGVVTYNLHKLF